MYTHNHISRNHYEKEFYKWLQEERKKSEPRSRQMVIELARLELLADVLGFRSSKLFSRLSSDVLETCTEFIKSGVLKEYILSCRSCIIDPLDALKEYMTYITDKLNAEHKPKQKRPLLWNNNSVLYVHKGKISCQQNGHNIISTTAVLVSLGNKTVELNVSYCQDCKKFFIGEEEYNAYRKKYGALIGNIRLESYGTCTYTGELLSEASPLRLCGYTVNKTDNLPFETRWYIIAKIISTGIMRKSEVISYLEYFIDHNGRQDRNQAAVEKWRRDLVFTMNYRIEEQDRYRITDIKPYVSHNYFHRVTT